MYIIPAGIFSIGFITDPVKVNTGIIRVWGRSNKVKIIRLDNIVSALFFVDVLYRVALKKEIAALK